MFALEAKVVGEQARAGSRADIPSRDVVRILSLTFRLYGSSTSTDEVPWARRLKLPVKPWDSSA